MKNDNNKMRQCPVWHGEPGQECSGFSVNRITALPELGSIAIEAQHNYSGAQVLHLYAEDQENLFALAFKTPPPDDTGIAHILEHAVLGGSRKYPVKEPFVEMLKMSMATFINAMTYPDKTVYPAASNVKKDFFNLFDVYFDAAFHSAITPTTLKQEGHHLAFKRPGDIDSPLTIRGIVYNEMKGAYSDLDSLIGRTGFNSLFTQSPYRFDSGGNPEKIPELTYEQFKKFYDTYYHPSNARIFLYGDIPPEEQFEFLDVRLRECSPSPAGFASPRIAREQRWREPIVRVEEYPIALNQDIKGKAAVTVNWLVGDISDPLVDLAMEVVDQLLLGHNGAPLSKALIESELGSDLTPSGYDNECWETSFHTGLKGTDADRQEEIERLVFKTLEQVVADGFDEEQVKRALHQMEYSHREIQSMFPLRLMEDVYNSWLYDYDPLTYLRTNHYLTELRSWYARNPDCFTDLIRERMLENQHRCTVLLQPRPGLQQERQEELATKLEKLRGSKSRHELKEIDKEANRLEELQGKPNDPRDVACLPQLGIDDIPSHPATIPRKVEELKNKNPFVKNEIFTNGINYLLLGFDVRAFPASIYRYIPLFCSVIPSLGTDKLRYDEMAEKLAENTGRFQLGTFNSTDAVEPGEKLEFVTLSLKSLDSTLEKATNIARDLLNNFNLDDHERLANVISQIRQRSISSIIPAGHRFANRHAARNLSTLAAMEYHHGGLPQLQLVEETAGNFAASVDNLKEKLAAVKSELLSGGRLCCAYTGLEDGEELVKNFAEQFIPDTPSYRSPDTASAIPVPDAGETINEGLAIEADVAYCARAWPAPHASDSRAPAVLVLSQLLSFDYLWDELRAKGGAYGAFALYNGNAETFSFVSYRDPHIKRTLDVYDGALEYIMNKDWSEDDVRRAVIACAKEDAKPIRPGWATSASLWRYLTRLTDEERQRRRELLQKVTVADVKDVARDILSAEQHPNTCVVSSRDQLVQANREMAFPLAIKNIISG
ncbi:MAG: insulinase family protein [Lentisphaeria bacterium]